MPVETLREMGELGFLGMLVPEEWGGADVGQVAYTLALEEIAAGDGALSTIMSVHNSVACLPILRFGTEAQKRRFLGALARGEMIGGFALTEPQAGSDASALKTRARRDGDGWVLTGTKQFITSGKTAGVLIVFAITDPAAAKNNMSAFIVPTDTPGFEVVRVEDKLGQHASDTCQIAFNDMRLAGDLLPGPSRRGLQDRALQPGRRTHRHRSAGRRHGARGVRGGTRLRARAHRLRQADPGAPGGRLSARRHEDASLGRAADGASRSAEA